MNAQNNTLGLNSSLVSAILTIADNLRGQYQKIGATKYQNPRNPFPMHKLVINALPTSKSKAMSLSQVREALQANGYHINKDETPQNRGHVYLSVTLAKLAKSGAVKRSGTHGNFRYWFAL